MERFRLIATTHSSSSSPIFGSTLALPFLFEATIRENIRYGRLNATDQDIEEAARLANAHSFISQLPDQYDTLLKEGGRGISEGQKQLLAIAQVILANPAILVLDEATSSIDTLMEINIQQALATLMNGRTSFIIAHRLQTIEKADRILVLQHGRIVQQGTHQALLQQDGLYRELYQKAATETG
ncbi:ABC-type multidrug transport system fused ATPase/permease subunit [Halalkalibacter oceani]